MLMGNRNVLGDLSNTLVVVINRKWRIVSYKGLDLGSNQRRAVTRNMTTIPQGNNGDDYYGTYYSVPPQPAYYS